MSSDRAAKIMTNRLAVMDDFRNELIHAAQAPPK
jgi:hypothetical protein